LEKHFTRRWGNVRCASIREKLNKKFSARATEILLVENL
jgi:hypothetical protein